MCSPDIFLGLLAVLFPPLPVWVKCGICSADSVINILLCCLGYVPGLLHAWYIIAKFPEPSYYDYERVDESERGGRVAYVVVRDDEQRRTPRPTGRSQPKPQQPPPRQGNMSYGTNVAGSAQQPEAGPSEGAPPPTYAQAVSGDHKIQDQS
ncbi:hypothetical protein N0V93_007689 [Gnomoniopsis smithogilvyi]|uniref:Stress response RCI peptide n=1 Tax=Gnomoniopsis smithogilvyi TaxID=1191159 RepID=A0A9W8YNW0_9PEZI|nr:hypothetical protein N0V93_007689 [Gnomoniopsis smithogilvyi]